MDLIFQANVTQVPVSKSRQIAQILEGNVSAVISLVQKNFSCEAHNKFDKIYDLIQRDSFIDIKSVSKVFK